MTDVFIEGKLGREFGNKFRFSVGRPKDVFEALDANKKGFKKRLIEMAQMGYHYSVIVDGETSEFSLSSQKAAKEIHIVPSIAGSAGIVVVGLTAAGILTSTSPAWIAPLITAVVGTALSFGINALLQKDQPQSNVGSASATANALNKSFLFSSGENVAEQGNPVPIAYGRLRVGSAVIQSTIKSFPAKFSEKFSLPVFSEFTDLATKKGLSHMGIVDNQQELQTDF